MASPPLPAEAGGFFLLASPVVALLPPFSGGKSVSLCKWEVQQSGEIKS